LLDVRIARIGTVPMDKSRSVCDGAVWYFLGSLELKTTVTRDGGLMKDWLPLGEYVLDYSSAGLEFNVRRGWVGRHAIEKKSHSHDCGGKANEFDVGVRKRQENLIGGEASLREAACMWLHTSGS